MLARAARNVHGGTPLLYGNAAWETKTGYRRPTFILNTAGWEPGVYVVRAIVGKESLTGKITVN